MYKMEMTSSVVLRRNASKNPETTKKYNEGNKNHH